MPNKEESDEIKLLRLKEEFVEYKADQVMEVSGIIEGIKANIAQNRGLIKILLENIEIIDNYSRGDSKDHFNFTEYNSLWEKVNIPLGKLYAQIGEKLHEKELNLRQKAKEYKDKINELKKG